MFWILRCRLISDQGEQNNVSQPTNEQGTLQWRARIIYLLVEYITDRSQADELVLSNYEFKHKANLFPSVFHGLETQIYNVYAEEQI